MKRRKTIVLCLGAGIAFLVQLVRGLVPSAAPGDIPSGAMNDPAAVCFSAALSAFVVWLALEIVFGVGGRGSNLSATDEISLSN